MEMAKELDELANNIEKQTFGSNEDTQTLREAANMLRTQEKWLRELSAYNFTRCYAAAIQGLSGNDRYWAYKGEMNPVEIVDSAWAIAVEASSRMQKT